MKIKDNEPKSLRGTSLQHSVGTNNLTVKMWYGVLKEVNDLNKICISETTMDLIVYNVNVKILFLLLLKIFERSLFKNFNFFEGN